MYTPVPVDGSMKSHVERCIPLRARARTEMGFSLIMHTHTHLSRTLRHAFSLANSHILFHKPHSLTYLNLSAISKCSWCVSQSEGRYGPLNFQTLFQSPLFPRQLLQQRGIHEMHWKTPMHISFSHIHWSFITVGCWKEIPAIWLEHHLGQKQSKQPPIPCANISFPISTDFPVNDRQGYITYPRIDGVIFIFYIITHLLG